MQINVTRKSSDTSLISHISNDKEKIEKYNNRQPIKNIKNHSEETGIKLEVCEDTMDFVSAARKSSLPKDYKTSNFFTGFHHQAYLENVQIAQNKSRTFHRSRSTSPVLPPIPYLTKRLQQNQNFTSSLKMSPRSRSKLIRELPQTHETENHAKHIFPNRTRISRSTSPINIKIVKDSEPRTATEDFPQEVPSNETEQNDKFSKCKEEKSAENDPPKERIFYENETPKPLEKEEPPMKNPPRENSAQIYCLDQVLKSFENSSKEETVTPSKILRHFQFKNREIKGIPKDIPEKLLNRSQRAHFDEAFREIVQNGNGSKFDDTSQARNEKEQLSKINQRSRSDGSFQGIRLQHQGRDHGSKYEHGISCQEKIQENSQEVPKQLNSGECFKYGESFQEENGDSEEIPARCQTHNHECRFGDATQERETFSTQQKSRFGKGNGSPKPVSTKFLNPNHSSNSDEAFQQEICENTQGNVMSSVIGQKCFSSKAPHGENENAKEFPTHFQNASHGCWSDDGLQHNLHGNSEKPPIFNHFDDMGNRKKNFLEQQCSQGFNVSQDKNETPKEDSQFCTYASQDHRRIRNGSGIKQCPNEISQLFYRNYGQHTFKADENVTPAVYKENFETNTKMRSPDMNNTKQTMAELTLTRNLFEDLGLNQQDLKQNKSFELEDNPNQNHNNHQRYQGNFSLERCEDRDGQLGTSRYYQHTNVDKINISSGAFEPRQKFLESIPLNGPKRPSSIPPSKRGQGRCQKPRKIELFNPDFRCEEKPTQINPVNISLIDSIKEKIFPSPRAAPRSKECKVPSDVTIDTTDEGACFGYCIVTSLGIFHYLTSINDLIEAPSLDEELNVWDEPENYGENLKFPKETKNAVRLMLSSEKRRVSWKNDAKHQVSVRQAQTQTSAKTSCTKLNVLKNRAQLPCPKNLLCEKGLHSGKCERGMKMMRCSKHCDCQNRRFWCPECQNVWPGSAQRCAENSPEEATPEDAFLQIMEPQWASNPRKIEKFVTRKIFSQQAIPQQSPTMNGMNGHANGELNGCDIITQNQQKGCWTIGLINSKFRYLTAETFGFKINANGSSLKKKQIWTLEPDQANGSESYIYLRSHLDKYLAVDSFGNVTCESDEKDPGCKFLISVAEDGTGRWAFRNVVRGYFLGSSSDKLTCTAKVPGDAEFWHVHLAARPQVNLRSVGRKRFAHLSENLDEIHVDANIPWGEDTLFTLEFRADESGKYALHTCNNKYLSLGGKLVDACTKDCLFTAEYHSGQLALRDRNGAYLSPIGSKAILKTRSNTVTKDELFSLEDSLPQASFVAALNSRYVSVKQGVDVTANQDEISDYETFQLEFDWSTKRWYIRTMQDRYWTLETGGGIQAAGDKRSSNALFDLIWQGDGSVAFRANNGRYVITKRSGHLYATSDSIDENCKYFFYLINRPILVLKSEQGFVGYKSSSSPKLECNKATYETIQVERAEKGVIHFKGQNGKYWHCDSEGVTADSDTPEGFYLELREPTRLSIKSVSGSYLTASKNGTFRLGESSFETATQWEY